VQDTDDRHVSRDKLDLLLSFYHIGRASAHPDVAGTRPPRSRLAWALEAFIELVEPDWSEWHMKPWFTDEEARTRS
jgi:hypothetical protein